MRFAPAAALLALCVTASCEKDPISPPPTGDLITLSQGQVSAISDRGNAIADANPSLRSFVDSTLQAIQAGVQMARVDIDTDLTDKPLYFVGIHRVVSQANGGSFSTWTLVGFEDPANFANIVQTSGFAQSSGASAPTSVSGTIGDGSGIVNGQLIRVNVDGGTTTFNHSSGTASFRSDPALGPCPKVNPAPATTCSLEVMHVTFSVTAAPSMTSSLTRHAWRTTEVAIPAMRLTYTP